MARHLPRFGLDNCCAVCRYEDG